MWNHYSATVELALHTPVHSRTEQYNGQLPAHTTTSLGTDVIQCISKRKSNTIFKGYEQRKQTSLSFKAPNRIIGSIELRNFK